MDEYTIDELHRLREENVRLRTLFRGREDVFARRWFSPTTDKSGLDILISLLHHPDEGVSFKVIETHHHVVSASIGDLWSPSFVEIFCH